MVLNAPGLSNHFLTALVFFGPALEERAFLTYIQPETGLVPSSYQPRPAMWTKVSCHSLPPSHRLPSEVTQSVC